MKLKIVLLTITAIWSLFLFVFYIDIAIKYEPRTTPQIFRLTIDNSFSPREVKDIYKGAKLWEDATGGSVKFIFHRGQVHMEVSNLDSIKDCIWRGHGIPLQLFEKLNIGGLSIRGYSPPGQFVILVPQRTASDSELIAVTAHELGHFMGMKHEFSIMTPYVQKPCISQQDLDQFCSFYNCKLQKPTCHNNKVIWIWKTN